MPLQKLALRPGVNRENTSYANEGGYYASNKIRFRSGMPEKIGGWVRDTGLVNSTSPTKTFVIDGTVPASTPPTGTLWGVCRALWNWINLTGYNLLGLGTNLKYYIQNGTNGYYYDVTPIRTTTAAGEVTFAASNGSAVITVTDVGHGAQTGDFVAFSGAVSLGGNITAAILNAEFQITYLTSNTYTITSSVAANASDSGNGGSSVIGAYQVTTGNDVFTQNVGWGAGTWGGVIVGTATNQLNGAINNSVTTITVDSTTAFAAAGNILIDAENISYTSKNSTQFLGCTRGLSGAGSGAAASHADNAVVVQSTTFTGWGDPAPAGQGIGEQLRTWSQSTFGEDLIFNPRGGALYYWANAASANTFNRAQYLGPSTSIATKYGTVTTDSSCPTIANFVMVSASSRFVLTFGVNDYPGTDEANIQVPMLIRWSDQESFATWFPAITNQAGSYRLSDGSQIVTAIQTRQEILVLTDSAIYSMQYLGPPYVWSFQILGNNISIAGPNAIATANNITYWMGTDKFYMYSGRVQTLPSTLREYVYTDINLEQSFQFMAGTNEGYNEVWWQYCSAGSNVIDRYVIYNHLDNVWYYGDWVNYTGAAFQGRTAWLDSALRANPMAATYGVAGGNTNTLLVYHESGVDDGVVNPPNPIVCQVTSSDFDIGDGHNFGFVWRLIPDLTFDGSNVNGPTAMFTVLPRANPGANYGPSNDPSVVSAQNYQGQRTYAVQQFTQQVYVRIRGRQMAFQVSSDAIGVQWQLGVPRIDIRPDGRR